MGGQELFRAGLPVFGNRYTEGSCQGLLGDLGAQEPHRGLVVPLHPVDGQDAPHDHLLPGADEGREHQARTVAEDGVRVQVQRLETQPQNIIIMINIFTFILAKLLHRLL